MSSRWACLRAQPRTMYPRQNILASAGDKCWMRSASTPHCVMLLVTDCFIGSVHSSSMALSMAWICSAVNVSGISMMGI